MHDPEGRHRLDLGRARAHFAGSLRVLSHDVTLLSGGAEFLAVHPGTVHYDQRALLMAEREDVVCVLNGVEERYLEYLGRLCLGPRPENVVAVASREGLGVAGALRLDEAALRDVGRRAGRRDILLEPYLASPNEGALARRLAEVTDATVILLGAPGATAVASRKDRQRLWAMELEIPVAEGEIVALEPGSGGLPISVAPLCEAVQGRLAAGDATLIRGSDGASGSATRLVRSAAELPELLDWAAARSEDTYLVDRLHQLDVSPNVLVFVPITGDPSFVAATDQMLDARLCHTGNRFPSRAMLLDRMVADAERLACLLQKTGYVGWLGVDFCEYRDPATGKRRMFLAELNLRINSSSYPVAVASEMRRRGAQIAAFQTGYLHSTAGSFSEFARRHGEHLLNGREPIGCLPYNTGALAEGYCAVLTLDRTPSAVEERWQRLGRSESDVRSCS